MGKFFRVLMLMFFLAILTSVFIIMYKGVPISSYTIEKEVKNEKL